jgi:hypothetical protein
MIDRKGTSNSLSWPFELYSIRPGPDGLARITVRWLGEPVGRSWLVPSAEAEHVVLDEWAQVHDALLGFPPSW